MATKPSTTGSKTPRKTATKTTTKPTAKTSTTAKPKTTKATAKPATPKAAPAKVAAQPAEAATPSTVTPLRAATPDAPVTPTEPVAAKPVLVRNALLDRVVKATGMKRADVRKVIDATLEEMGDALDRGDSLRLQPFGVAKVKRVRDGEAAKTLITQIRRKKPGETGKDPLADPEK